MTIPLQQRWNAHPFVSTPAREAGIDERPGAIAWITDVDLSEVLPFRRRVEALAAVLRCQGAIACLPDVVAFLRSERIPFAVRWLDPEWVGHHGLPVYVFGLEHGATLEPWLLQLHAGTLFRAATANLMASEDVLIHVAGSEVTVLTPPGEAGPSRWIMCHPATLFAGGPRHQLVTLSHLLDAHERPSSERDVVVELLRARGYALQIGAGGAARLALRRAVASVARAYLGGSLAGIAAWLSGGSAVIDTQALDASALATLERTAATCWRLDVPPIFASELPLSDECVAFVASGLRVLERQAEGLIDTAVLATLETVGVARDAPDPLTAGLQAPEVAIPDGRALRVGLLTTPEGEVSVGAVWFRRDDDTTIDERGSYRGTYAWRIGERLIRLDPGGRGWNGSLWRKDSDGSFREVSRCSDPDAVAAARVMWHMLGLSDEPLNLGFPLSG